MNFEPGARETRPHVTSISESSPCPVAPEAPEALDYVSEWLTTDAVPTKDPGLAAARSRLQRTLKADRLQLSNVRSCASEPEQPTWLWSALLSSGSANAPVYTPFYLRLTATQGSWRVLGVSSVAPPQCPLR